MKRPSMTKKKLPPSHPGRPSQESRRRKRELTGDFNAETEYLYNGVVRIEALACLADEALCAVPTLVDADRRRDMNRLYTLVETTAAVSLSVLKKAENDRRRLNQHMAGRPKTRQGAG